MRLYLSILILIIGILFLPVLADNLMSTPELNISITTNNTPNSTSATPSITPSPTPMPTVLSTVTLTASPTPTPVVTKTPLPTPTPTPEKTITPPLVIPEVVKTTSPTNVPTEKIASSPTVASVNTPSISTDIPIQQFIPTGAESPIGTLSISGNFNFISSPTGAAVTFNGALVGTTPVTVPVDETSVPPYSVTIQMPGYLDWTTSLNHNPGSGATEIISATLQPQPLNGSISVTSTPSGATVGLDGSDVRTTPYTYPQVTVGSHTVTISKDGYSPYTTTISVASGAQSVVSAVLNQVSNTGSLTVETSPPGAAILLNGIVYGISPSHFGAIAAGTYELKLEKPGFQPVTKTVEISSGKENSVQVSLPRRIPLTGMLTIRSFPSGGIVTLDGDTRGITPVRIPWLNPDSYNVRVSIPGFMSWIGIIDIAPGRETVIYATLQPKGTVTYTGALAVQSIPAGASVYLDSYPQGKTPVNIQNLAGGTHTVVLSYPGYEPVTAIALIQAGQTSEISATLTPYQVENLSPALITLSDDAATYFTTHGRMQALQDFDRQDSGFSRDNQYVITLDLNGTVLSDGGNPNLIGRNLSSPGNDGVSQGDLIATMARLGGGLLYVTNLTEGDSGPISLVYVRPAISGVIIGTVTPVPSMTSPEIPSDIQLMREQVHAAVLHARQISTDQAQAGVESDSSASSSLGILMHPYDAAITNDIDQNGVSPTRLLMTAAEAGGAYVWIPMFDGTSKVSSLILGYAEKVDDSWGIWASKTGDGHNVIIMMDAIPVQV